MIKIIFCIRKLPGLTDGEFQRYWREDHADLVREAADHAGEDFVVFTTSDGGQGYSQMFVMPLDAVDAR